ncbi:protein SPT2 isoform X2 [Cinnamomum micranthum f. kanehirae]|uniref:Protein SPT2 isoform X2 n=1 Tax=Cinnamomum micranthum f. kanehirae TaxID=337451 RepID=A0A443NHD0_9MAGN|nr:protein SPT2 isoform X2 [Cinnamomum micranthum f. kanehirae]
MKPPKQMPAHSMREDRPKKRPANWYSDEDMDDGEEAIRMIRNMFGYNPKKYADVDVGDMEANFDDILKEERRSAKIAREEDEQEQCLIEEEERRIEDAEGGKEVQALANIDLENRIKEDCHYFLKLKTLLYLF